jgi:hypothetical protein
MKPYGGYISIIPRREIARNIPDITFFRAKTVPDEMIGVLFSADSTKACRRNPAGLNGTL